MLTSQTTLMGSAVSQASSFCSIPFLVYKSKLANPDCLVYGVCVDGSEKCLNALRFTARLATPKDRLVLIYALHTSRENHSEAVRRLCADMLPGQEFAF
jgi:hypothetical protein